MKKDDYSVSGMYRVSVLLAFREEIELNTVFSLHVSILVSYYLVCHKRNKISPAEAVSLLHLGNKLDTTVCAPLKVNSCSIQTTAVWL